MRVHHLNCISACPLGGRLMDGFSTCIACRATLSCHCLLVETDSGLVMVDTGYGLNDVRHPRQRLSSFFLALMSPDFQEGMTAVRQVERLGFKASDVRHVVLTHLDFDHAGGLDDFPLATVHLMRAERDDAVRQKSWLDRQRFRPQQWGSRERWKIYEAGSTDRWFGFDCVRELAGLPPEILMVPLRGHTLGHAGVAIRSDGGWLLQAGDAYFHHREMDPSRPWCTPGLRFYQTMMEKDRAARFDNQRRLREVADAHRTELRLFCSHDLGEFDAMKALDGAASDAGGRATAAI